MLNIIWFWLFLKIVLRRHHGWVRSPAEGGWACQVNLFVPLTFWFRRPKVCSNVSVNFVFCLLLRTFKAVISNWNEFYHSFTCIYAIDLLYTHCTRNKVVKQMNLRNIFILFYFFVPKEVNLILGICLD